MEKNKIFTLLLLIGLALSSCGPVVITSRPNHPPPSWFYPNRVEEVRYVYFPEHFIYYDLTLSNYLYLNNGAWVRVNVLPSPYHIINLNRSKYVRVKGYRGTTISDYHNKNRGRSNTNSSIRGRRN